MGSTNKIKIACWNSRGYTGAIPYLRKLTADNDIVAVSEHWLHGNKLNRLSEVSADFNFCARASKLSGPENYGVRRGQGGVALFWRKSMIGIREFTSIIHDIICGIRLQTEHGGVLNIFSVYLPAMGCGEDYEACLDDLAEILESREHDSSSIICGDLNGDVGKEIGTRGLSVPNRNGRSLVKFINEFGLIACNLTFEAKGPLHTHVGNNSEATLDYILVTGDLNDHVVSCHTTGYDVLNTSDHRAVNVEVGMDNLRSHTLDCQKDKVLKWDKLGREDIEVKYTRPLQTMLAPIIQRLQRHDLDEHDVDVGIDDINCCLNEAATAIPTSTFKAHLRPYWNKVLTNLKKNKLARYREWVADGKPREPDDQSWADYKLAKKAFSKELRSLSKFYEDEQVAQAVKAANVDRGLFWRLVKKARGSSGNKTTGIRNKEGKVVNTIEDALGVWRSHFSSLGTPKDSSEYDNQHYDMVTREVEALNKSSDSGRFLQQPFKSCEIRKAIGKLHKRKACGIDGISSEHLIYAGEGMVEALTLLYNHIIRLEYVPINLRRCIQIPLFKGKGLCCLDVNSYRGISLLTNYNKIYEILLWERMSNWWVNDKVISDLQGAGKKGQSCVHTAFVLQEAIATARESGHKVFVAYFDVSKAYDTVWTDGLFFQLHKMGVNGKMWRLMYRAYLDFKCKVRLGSQFSEWYPLLCGIHQGGFLSLTKYVAFINSLILELERSKLCCQLHSIPASPAGYADDLAAACISKFRIDNVMTVVSNFGRKWRFQFNAKKSAVLVYGEEKGERVIGSKNRMYKLGNDKVNERLEYDHVGIKACVLNNNSRVEEKVAKGRRALNASAGLGIRRNGLSVATCNMVFWTIVIPIVTFGCELWVLHESDILKLNAFQRYAGRRVQRFPQRSPSGSSFYGLGWIRIETLILVKKVLFIHTFLRMKHNSIIVSIFKARVVDYLKDVARGETNVFDSPVYDLINASKRLGVKEEICNMLAGNVNIVSKVSWSKLVWAKAWALDDAYWISLCMINRANDVLFCTIPKSKYLIWWQMADKNSSLQYMGETMARLICRASRLKDDDPGLKEASKGAKMCQNCDLGIAENLYHLIMQCPAMYDLRNSLYSELDMYAHDFSVVVNNNPQRAFSLLVGKLSEDVDISTNCLGLEIVGKHVCAMYKRVLSTRKGIG